MPVFLPCWHGGKKAQKSKDTADTEVKIAKAHKRKRKRKMYMVFGVKLVEKGTATRSRSFFFFTSRWQVGFCGNRGKRYKKGDLWGGGGERSVC